MKAIKAIYHKGEVTLSEKPSEPGPLEVLVVFPVTSDDPWTRILDDPKPRPALDRLVKKVRREIAADKAKPLDLRKL